MNKKVKFIIFPFIVVWIFLSLLPTQLDTKSLNVRALIDDKCYIEVEGSPLGLLMKSGRHSPIQVNIYTNHGKIKNIYLKDNHSKKFIRFVL